MYYRIMYDRTKSPSFYFVGPSHAYKPSICPYNIVVSNPITSVEQATAVVDKLNKI